MYLEKESSWRNIHACQHNNSLLIEWLRPKSEKGDIIVKRTAFHNMRDEYLGWLLALNDNFDDDLLQDAMWLLGYE